MHSEAKTLASPVVQGEVSNKMHELVVAQDELVQALCLLQSRLEDVLAPEYATTDQGHPSAPCSTTLGTNLDQAVTRTRQMREHVGYILGRLEL